MSYKWNSPIELGILSVQGIKCVLPRMNAFTLTNDNLPEFIRMNRKLKIVRHQCDTDEEAFRPLIRFTYWHTIGRQPMERREST
jgi:hypothetical protein